MTTYVKSTTIVPLPKQNNITCLNDYCPIAHTSIVMKCFERTFMSHIKKANPNRDLAAGSWTSSQAEPRQNLYQNIAHNDSEHMGTPKAVCSVHSCTPSSHIQLRPPFLRNPRTFGLSSKLLSSFNRCTVESILAMSITVWYGNCTIQDRKALQGVINMSQFNCGAAFPPLQDIYNTWVTNKAHNIIKDRSTHCSHSCRRYMSGKTTKKTVSTHRPSGWITNYCTLYCEYSTLYIRTFWVLALFYLVCTSIVKFVPLVLFKVR